MSRFTRYRAKARKKKEESQQHLENFYNRVIETLQVLKCLVKRIGEDKWNSLTDEEKVKLGRDELLEYNEFKKYLCIKEGDNIIPYEEWEKHKQIK